MTEDENFMKRCFDLAQLGQGSVSPNPMVGSVIVHHNKIIGEGYHQRCGEAHAEVNAINSIKDKSLLPESTIYVNLEPCSHHGKTPPCADLIVAHKLKRVVISCLDSNPAVSGRGVKRLRNNTIEVESGILEEEGRFLNRRFFTFQEKQRPYIILKWAQSADGFMDRVRNDDVVKINWISHKNTKKLTHQWRAEEDAILVGKQTVVNDNPSLTTREVEGKNPTRIVIDPENTLKDLADQYHLFNNEAETLIINTHSQDKKGKTEYIQIANDGSLLDTLLAELYQRKIQSLIIEGGKKTLEAFIHKGLWDEARIITGSSTFHEGLSAPLLDAELINEEHCFGDKISFYLNS